MIRQAHTYLAGAVSSTALVAAAVVAFVLLVSLQALKEWPLAGIGIGGEDSAVTGPSEPGAAPASASAQAAGAAATVAGPATNGGAGRRGERLSRDAASNQTAVDPSPTASTGSPTAQAPPPSPSGPGGSGPSGSSSPTGSASSSPASGGGGSNPGAGGGSTGSSEGGGQTTSGAITGTVNKTVSGVDEATGGAIGSTGVTEVTEKAVEGVAGPESTVGHSVDEAVKTVGGLLGGDK
jgi:hypothetical protein